MKKKNTKKILIVILVILLILTIYNAYNHTKFNALKTITTEMYRIIIPHKSCEINQSEDYLIQKNLNKTKTREIKELKKLLDLKTTTTEFEIENSTVISRNVSYWLNNLMIDKGKSSKVLEDMIVITNNGLIGKIISVSKNTSEVKLITSNDNLNINVTIEKEDGETYGLLSGYDNKNEHLIVTDIDKNSKVEIGDTVKTSGLSKNCPRGIYVGKVEKIETDKYDLKKILYVKSKQNFNDIHYVSIVKD